MKNDDKIDFGGVDQYNDQGGYTTIKDSKHTLQDGVRYVVLHYTGPDIFLIQPWSLSRDAGSLPTLDTYVLLFLET